MAKETWLDAAEAVELGFADRLAEPVRIAASFDVGRFRNAPLALVEAVEASCDAAGSGTEDGPAKSEEAAMEEAPTIAAPANDVVLEEVAEQAPVSSAAEPPAPPCTAVAVPDPEAPGTETAATDPVGSPAAVRAEIVAHAAAVIDLCALAGLPLQARRFLEAEASLDDVRAALLAARADATPEVIALHPQPGRPADAKPWGEVIARTFKPRG
jgi:hypothetical protein